MMVITSELMIEFTFYLAAAIAIGATGFVIFTRNVVHALISLILSLLAVAVVIYLLGAPFAAALEVIIYAGAIMVLFVFAIMMLDFDPKKEKSQRPWLKVVTWGPPLLLAILLIAEVVLTLSPLPVTAGTTVGPKPVGLALFGPYIVATILAALLLLSGLIGAYHLSRRDEPQIPQRRSS